jgi:hypothetical protein
MSELVLNGVTVIKRKDGMINATALCKAGGQRWPDFIRLDGAKAFVTELTKGNFNRADLHS